MIQEQFANHAIEILKKDKTVIGLAAGGSWLTNEIDEFSDLDLVLVTTRKVAGNKNKMLAYAQQLGTLLNGFTGEHVGEPRLLICLYDNPLLHVDIKFLVLEEFHRRIENPAILLDTDGQLQKVIADSAAKFPYPDYQWIEDRFWTWIHYVLLKIGRGEYLEAFDSMGIFRNLILGPLLHIKNGNLPRGVRKAEQQLSPEDFQQLQSTLPAYTKTSLLNSLANAVTLYRHLRKELFTGDIVLQKQTEERVMTYFEIIKRSDNSF
jgi:hypothetical protein